MTPADRLGRGHPVFGPRLIQGVKGEAPLDDFNPAVRHSATQGPGLNLFRHRSRADFGDVGVAADYVAHVHRLVKDEAVNRDGGDAVQRVLSGDDAASHIHLTHQSAAKNFAGRVNVGMHGERAQSEVAV